MKLLGKNDVSFEKYKGLSSTGVQIMPSMASLQDACTETEPEPLAAKARAGFKLCSFVEDFLTTEACDVPVIKTRLGKDDLFSSFYVRLGISRHRYFVGPGLYAVGKPDNNSEVLVTANFKLTFDSLRKELAGINAWILVLDTKGVNVWCAAGKGTFATGELVSRIKAVSLEKIVSHRRLILPQLGATGVCSADVKKQSGFRVIYGPIRAEDIREFLNKGKKADKKMRQVTFSLYERFILTPIEIQILLKPKPVSIVLLVLFFLSGIGPGIFSIDGAWQRGLLGFWAMVTGILSGAVLTPVLLPAIPVRSFALKGMIAGSVTALIFLIFVSASIGTGAGRAALFLLSVTISSYLAMNFTGSTPFASPSGVEKEMKQYIPVQLAGLLLSTGLWIYSAF